MSNCISTKEPPSERHVRWCERSENESRKKTTSFSSYSIGKHHGAPSGFQSHPDGLRLVQINVVCLFMQMRQELIEGLSDCYELC